MRKAGKARWEAMDRQEVDLSTLIEIFETHNRTDGKSPRTVGWYNEVLNLLYCWLREEGLPTALATLDEMTIRRFILYLQERPGLKGEKASSHTVYNRVNALKSFFGWLFAKGYTKEHRLEDLKQPKTSQVIVEPLTEQEIGRVLSVMDTKTVLGARNTAIVWLMLDTGLRLSEVSTLKEADMHLNEQYQKVMGKGSKERMVAFGVRCQAVLMQYYLHFRPQPACDGVDTFFLTIDGYPMTADSIRSVIKRLAKSSGVRRLHAHLLRHTYATRFLINGGDVFTLKHNLGHATLTMVQNYVHIANDTVAVRNQSFSPMDRMTVGEDRRFRHAFTDRDDMDGRIYPNAGKRGKQRRLRKRMRV